MALKHATAGGAAVVAVASVSVTGAAHSTAVAATVYAPASSQICNVKTYKPRVRNVTTKRGVQIVTALVKVYPGRTVIGSKKKIRTKWRVNVRAGLGANFEESVGGGINLAEVVKASDETKFGISATVDAGWNDQKSTIVTNSTKQVIPKAASVVWFAGFQTVHGTFQYSTCPQSGTVEDGGDESFVRWHRLSWHSFQKVRESGGQRCDVPAESYVAAAARKDYCVKG